jgi:hypothetical protein
MREATSAAEVVPLCDSTAPSLPTCCRFPGQVPLLRDFPEGVDVLLAFELGAEFHQNYFRYSRNRSITMLRKFPDSDDGVGRSHGCRGYCARVVVGAEMAAALIEDA